MKLSAAVVLVLCVSCAPVAHMQAGPAPERWGLAPAGYYVDEPQARKVAGAVALTCAVIAGFVIAWPEIEDILARDVWAPWFGH